MGGNPNEKKYHDYMLAYSPVDNVKRNKYPSLLITAGLNDPRVPYWEPAKWVARLRDAQTDKAAPMLLKTDMSSGHFSASDRYKLWRNAASSLPLLPPNSAASSSCDSSEP